MKSRYTYKYKLDISTVPNLIKMILSEYLYRDSTGISLSFIAYVQPRRVHISLYRILSQKQLNYVNWLIWNQES